MRKVSIVLAFILFGGLAWLAVGLATLNTQSLIACAGNEGGVHIPQAVCWRYLRHVRDSTDDVKVIDDEIGLAFVLNGKDKLKYQIADFYLAQGADINAINGVEPFRMSALQAAVLLGDVESVDYLLQHKADADLASPSLGLSALQIAQTQDIPNQKRVISLLTEPD